mgnify:FL=1
MAGTQQTFANDLLKLIFYGTTIANIAQNAASSPITDFYITLHTADPGETGNQASSETTYTGYARKIMNRSATDWAITNDVVSPAATVSFAACTGGSAQTITHIGIGTNGTTGAAGKLLFSGSISPSIIVQNGVTPQLTVASTITFA